MKDQSEFFLITEIIMQTNKLQSCIGHATDPYTLKQVVKNIL